MLDDLYKKNTKIKQQEYPLAKKEALEVLKRGQQGKMVIKPFQPFATAVCVSLHSEFVDRVFELEKELKEIGKQRLALKIEYDTVMKLNMAPFEERSDKVGEGNPDPTLDEEIYEA